MEADRIGDDSEGLKSTPAYMKERGPVPKWGGSRGVANNARPHFPSIETGRNLESAARSGKARAFPFCPRSAQMFSATCA
jgi:hypothetical protein